MQPQDLVGQSLGHYRITRQVGYGGMATVFLAEDFHLGREVTLKVFWPRLGDTQNFLRRFEREARVLAQLDHPNILPVYDYGEQGDLAYLVTPYMSGGSLKDVLSERKALPPLEATQLVSQVLPALQYAHDRNLIHRDIKPGNLLFKGDGSLVLADFGLVKVVEEEGQAPAYTISETGQSIAGTPEYMAPEQIQGRAEPASDIYALGVVLYEMVAGQRPFTGESLLNVLMKHASETPRPPRERNPYVSPQLQAIILKALEKEPQKRFARPADFLQALQQLGNPGSTPDAGRRNNPASHPGREQSGPAAGQYTTAEYGPTQATHWTQAPARGGRSTDLPRSSDPHWPQNPIVLPVQATSSPFVHSQGAPPPGPPVLTPPPVPQKRSRTPVVVLLLLLALLAGLIASLFLTPMGALLFGPQFSPAHPPITHNTPAPIRGAHSPTPGPFQAVPQTTTDCPLADSARAAVMAPFAPGHDPTIVYLVNESDSAGNPTFGTIKMYDTVTGQKTEVAKTRQTRVDEAQVSNDGEWVLFAATVAGRSELRMVRLDGQGLQTLLCAPSRASIRGSQWSLDQKYVIFDEFPQSVGSPTVYLLNIQSGALQVEVNAPSSGIALLPRTWLDYHRVLLVGIVPDSDTPPQNIYVLDISNGAHQNVSSTQQAFVSSQPCWDFDSSYDGHALFLVQCTYGQPGGSSSIVQQPIDGGTSISVLNSATLTFNTLRVIDPRSIKLLALASDNGGLGAGQGDPTHDGLYLIQADNSAPPLRLTSTPTTQSAELNPYSQYFWSNVSRDETLYALELVNTGTNVDTLTFGPLSGGQPTTFASLGNGTSMSFAGWTTV
ncbi:MAG TPA: protein kinase [Ktedonobacteraceae bacterium]|jgi:serine/threonine protein kinase